MVLVFGLDVPLFEFLLVFMVLLTAGIIFVLLELKRLNEYLIIERSDLKRLERDLGVLEHEEQRLDEEEDRLALAGAPKVPKTARKASKKSPGRPKKSSKKASKKSPGRPKKSSKKTAKKRPGRPRKKR